MMLINGFKNTVLIPIIIGFILMISCGSKSKNKDTMGTQVQDLHKTAQNQDPIIVGANQTENYLHLLKGKRVGIVANQTSVIFKDRKPHSKNKNYTHLVDSLMALNISIKKVFAPEHGFRGTADAGEVVKDGIDTKTNLPVVSLYGAKNRKPQANILKI